MREGIEKNLREILRELASLETSLELQRGSLHTAIMLVDQMRNGLERPVPQGG